MTLGRREFVVGSVGAAALSSIVTGCSGGGSDTGSDAQRGVVDLPVDAELFAHGIASGDPLQDRVILWSRISGMTDSVEVDWLVASDPELRKVVKSGTATASEASDFTVKVDVTGLSVGATYYYAFSYGQTGRSKVGRTRTLPDPSVSHVRFAFTSCANYNNGFFHAYRAIAERSDLDVWIHLGDYIYEYADGVYGSKEDIGRAYVPANETITLADYRARYAQYRGDPDLQEVHRQHPAIIVWDDHEVADNASLVGAVNHDPSEGDYQERKRAGTQAFVEWLPIRVADTELPPRIYRSFQFGNLFDLIMLDTRLIGRDLQAGGLQSPGDPALWVDPTRQLLGTEQEQWLGEELIKSRERGATWRVLGNQVMFARTKNPLTNQILNADAWDGYQAARDRVITQIKENGIDNLVLLTGDIHTSWAFDLAVDPFSSEGYDRATGSGSFGVELVGPAVTSRGLEWDEDTTDRGYAEALLSSTHPHLKFLEVTRKGYVLVDVQEERVQAEWYFVANHLENSAEARQTELAKAFVCSAKSAHLVEVDEATPPKKAPVAAPDEREASLGALVLRSVAV